MTDPAERKRNSIKQQEEVDGIMKEYLNPHDRFATRMGAAVKKNSVTEEEDDNNPFVDKTGV